MYLELPNKLPRHKIKKYNRNRLNKLILPYPLLKTVKIVKQKRMNKRKSHSLKSSK